MAMDKNQSFKFQDYFKFCRTSGLSAQRTCCYLEAQQRIAVGSLQTLVQIVEKKTAKTFRASG